jgi:hypothetical protein
MIPLIIQTASQRRNTRNLGGARRWGGKGKQKIRTGKGDQARTVASKIYENAVASEKRLNPNERPDVAPEKRRSSIG